MAATRARGVRAADAMVDTNVLLDLANDTAPWAAWSEARLEEVAARGGRLFADPVVFAEFCVGCSRLGEAEAFFAHARVRVVPTPREGLFLASQAFLAYRRAGGVRTGVLPDFLVGAHASALGVPLLTRDAGRFGTYFPTLRLVTPRS